MKLLKLNILTAAFILSFTATAQAIPTLQLYLEGGTYDSSSESWTMSNSGTFKLWVLGQDGVYDVKLAAAYATGENGTISLTPTTASSIYAPQDTTLSDTPVIKIYNADGTIRNQDGTIPLMGDGSPLPTHGTYGSGTSWTEWLLGDFFATSDKVADMTADPLNWKPGQLNAYDVTIAGFSSVSFDAYDHVVYSKNKYRYVKAPFSHDAEATQVPEPGTFALLGAGLFGLAIYGKRRRNRQ